MKLPYHISYTKDRKLIKIQLDESFGTHKGSAVIQGGVQVTKNDLHIKTIVDQLTKHLKSLVKQHVSA